MTHSTWCKMTKTLFVGDVHGCADELEELCVQVGPSRVFLVGDLFTKGPKPRKVWKLIQKYKMNAVLGNHDVAARRRPDLFGLKKSTVNWLYSLPMFISEDHWTVVHAGVHPFGGLTTGYMSSVMRLWGEDSSWFEYYKQNNLIIYGHDAVRGLQDNRPYTLGLDTGCVYGGRLTGYVLETDTLVGVPARKTYCPV